MTAGHEAEERLRELRKRLGDALRAARQAKGMSLRKFAQILVRSHGNLSEWETGVRLPPRDVVEAYERELDAKPGSLLALWTDAQPAAEKRPRRPLRHRTADRPIRPPAEPGDDARLAAVVADDDDSPSVLEVAGQDTTVAPSPTTPSSAPAPVPLSAPRTDSEPARSGSLEAVVAASAAKEGLDSSAQPAGTVVPSQGTPGLSTRAAGTDAGASIPRSTERQTERSADQDLHRGAGDAPLPAGAAFTPTGTPTGPPSAETVRPHPVRLKTLRKLGGKHTRAIAVVLGMVLIAAGIRVLGGTPEPKDPPVVVADFEAMAVDGRTGEVYVADFAADRIYRLTPSGKVEPFAGSGGRGFGGDGGPATAATLHGPSGLAVDRSGNVLIADQLNGRVRKVSPDGMITTVAITGADGKPVAGTGLDRPTRVAVDKDGNLYVADAKSRLLQKVGQDGRMVTVAGGGPKPPGDATSARDASFTGVTGLAVDILGDLYLTTDHRLLKVVPDGRIIVVAGTGVSGFSGDGGPAEKAQFAFPSGIAVDRHGRILVADQGNGRVREIVDGRIDTVAGGGGSPPDQRVGRKATELTLNAPRGVAVDHRGNVLIDDAAQGGLRKLWPSGRMTTLAITPIASLTTTTTTITTTTTTPPTTTIPPYGPIFNDPFTRQTGWSVNDTGDATSVYADGGYRLTVTRGTNGTSRTVPLQRVLSPGGPVPNDALTIESKVTFESTSFQAGLVCRGKSGEGGGYRAQVTGVGIWGILRFEPGAASGEPGRTLVGGPASRAAEMRTDAPNQLRLDCFGGTSGGPVILAFYVNGQELGRVEDPEGLPAGDVRLAAQIAPNSRTETASGLFDDFVVSRQRWPVP